MHTCIPDPLSPEGLGIFLMRLWVVQGGWQAQTGSPGLEHSCLPLACCRHQDGTELLCSITETAFPRLCFWRERVPKGVQFSDKLIAITQVRACIVLRLQTQLRAVVLQCSVFLRGLWLQAHLSPSLCVTLQQLATPPAGQVLQSLSVCRACAVTAVLVQLYPRGWGILSFPVAPLPRTWMSLGIGHTRQ